MTCFMLSGVLLFMSAYLAVQAPEDTPRLWVVLCGVTGAGVFFSSYKLIELIGGDRLGKASILPFVLLFASLLGISWNAFQGLVGYDHSVRNALLAASNLYGLPIWYNHKSPKAWRHR